jgi:hypothetical protein
MTPVRQPVGRPRERPAKLHGDKGYEYRALSRRRIKARIASKGIESAARLGRDRYVIERCLEWVTRFPAPGPPLRTSGFSSAVKLNVLSSNNPN